MRPSNLRAAAVATVLVAAALAAMELRGGAAQTNRQPPPDESPAGQGEGIRLGEPVVEKWRIGYVITAQGDVAGATAYATAPMDWPEQSVRIVDEDVSPSVKAIRYRTIGDGARQMMISIPRLRAGETATAIVTFEVSKRPIEAPETTEHLRIPQRPGADLKPYLSPSPAIESNDRQIQSLAATIAPVDGPAWEQVGGIFDWVREHIVYKFDETQRGALAALRAEQGDCEELTALFIALCRVRGIPARSVWVPGHCYPEFYLEDDSGKGYWFPCQAAGAARDFGRMNEPRPILQKGDNFKLPGERRPQHYVHEKFEARSAAAPPRVEFVREKAP